MGILNNIKKMLWKNGNIESEEEMRLTARVEVRIRPSEKELLKAFCSLQNISMGELMRNASLKYIDNFIQIND